MSKVDDLSSVPKHQSILQDIEEVGALLSNPHKRPFEIIHVPHLVRLERHGQHTSRIIRLFPGHRIGWVGGISENSSVGQTRCHLLENFQTLRAEFRIENR